MPSEQGKGMRRSIAAASSGRLARCAAGRAARAAVSRRFSHSIAQNHSHRRNCRPRSARLHLHRPFLLGCPQATTSAVVRTYGGIGYLSPLRLAVPPPASLPPSLPLTAIYPSLIGLRNLSRTGKDEASEGAKEGGREQTMEETEGRTFTFAILSLSSAARSLRRRDPRGKWVCSRQPCHTHERDRRSAHRDEV